MKIQRDESTLLQRMKFVQQKLRLPDEKLAWYLGVHPKQLAAFIGGRDELPSHAAFILLDRTLYVKVSDVLLQALPPAVREKLRNWETRHAQWIAENNVDVKAYQASVEGDVMYSNGGPNLFPDVD